MDILNPPKIYIDYRCCVYGLSGLELVSAQERFFKKHSEDKVEITKFFNYLQRARNELSLPFEKVEIREADGKKHGHVISAIIYDIEYWIENDEIKKRKIYIGDQGLFQ